MVNNFLARSHPGVRIPATDKLDASTSSWSGRTDMKTLHCTHCQNLVFFENVRCLRCNHGLAYLPWKGVMAAFEEHGDGTVYPSGSESDLGRVRRCRNSVEETICNWALPEGDDHELCQSCRLTEVIPELAKAGNRVAWYRLESA